MEGEEEGPDYEGFCRQIVKTMSDSLEQRTFRTVSLYQVSTTKPAKGRVSHSSHVISRRRSGTWCPSSPSPWWTATPTSSSS